MHDRSWLIRLPISFTICCVAACSDDGLSAQDSTTAQASGLGDGDGDGGGTGGDPSGGESTAFDDGNGSGDADDGTGEGDDGGEGNGYCPDVEPWPDDLLLCLTQADCPEFYTCDPNGPTSGPQCGKCWAPEMYCATDAECVELGQVCEPFDDPCACRPGLACTPPCQESGCEEGQVCQRDGHCGAISCEDEWACDARTEICDPLALAADPHGCLPTPCDAGWTCEPGWVCMLGEVGSDPHGCLPIHCEEPGGVACGDNFQCDAAVPGSGCALAPCVTAADCDCGSCIDGLCRTAPGVCISPPPP